MDEGGGRAGLAAIEDLITSLLNRSSPNATNLPLPILSLVGPHGSDKSHLLRAADRALADKGIPHARLDFEANPDVTPRQVLAYLAFELNRRSRGYGRIVFRRFLVAERVIRLELGSPLDGAERRAAVSKVKESLKEFRQIDKVKVLVDELAGETARMVPPPFQPGAAVAARSTHLLIDGLVRWPLSRRVILGEAVKWFAGHSGLPVDSFDALVDLNRLARGNREETATADGIVWAAFLADLGEAFAPGVSKYKRPLYACVLLDNTDHRAGAAFLERYVQARIAGAEMPGPVLIVAAARSPRRSSIAAPQRAERAGLADWHQQIFSRPAVRSAESWWYPIEVQGLTETEIGQLFVQQAPPAPPRSPRFVYRLTSGHPDASRLLVKVIRERVDGRPGDVPDLRCLFDWPSSVAGAGQLPMVLLHRLLGETDEQFRELLVTCSAARDLADASRMLVLSATVPGKLLAELNAAHGWAVHEDRRVLHPLVRRLLILMLADRPAAAADSWEQVHQQLLHLSIKNKDRVGEMFHLLALGRVAEVVEKLQTRFTAVDVPAAAWLAEFEEIVSAPNRLTCDREPTTWVQELTAWCDPSSLLTACLARLTVERWISCDPLGDPKGRLLRAIAGEYRTIAPFSRTAFSMFMDEADRFEGME